MTQRIDGTGTLNRVLTQLQSRSSGAQSSQGPLNEVSAGSSLNLTEAASQMRQLAANASGGEPSFDVEKVNAIRAALADGRYAIDAGAIANRLLAFEQELGG